MNSGIPKVLFEVMLNWSSSTQGGGYHSLHSRQIRISYDNRRQAEEAVIEAYISLSEADRMSLWDEESFAALHQWRLEMEQAIRDKVITGQTGILIPNVYETDLLAGGANHAE